MNHAINGPGRVFKRSGVNPDTAVTTAVLAISGNRAVIGETSTHTKVNRTTATTTIVVGWVTALCANGSAVIKRASCDLNHTTTATTSYTVTATTTTSHIELSPEITGTEYTACSGTACVTSLACVTTSRSTITAFACS